MKQMTNIIYSTLALFALHSLAFSPQARAVCQEGCIGGNTVLGDNALLNNTTGFANTAIGQGALFSNTNGSNNTAVGANTLTNSTTANFNTATGDGALQNTTTGTENTATGAFAMLDNTTGDSNTAIGLQALEFNKTGNDNTAIGHNALLQARGSSNIALGSSAGLNITAGSNNIAIGNVGGEGDTGIIRIGTAGTQTATFIAGIRGTPLSNGAAIAVGITADGQLGVRVSSAQFKEAIKPMNKASEAIFSLQPVTFRYKKDPAALAQFGLVAEEVAKVSPDLVARDKEGKPFTVRYEEVNAMLLNEFLKEHKKVEALETKLAKVEAMLEKVSARLETEETTPRLVENR